MSSSVSRARVGAHRVNGEIKPRMAKADLPKGENAPVRSDWRLLGECLDVARHALGWTVDRLARELRRDEKQVSRWMRGEERPQVEIIIEIPALDAEYAIALAARKGCVVETVVRLQRRLA